MSLEKPACLRAFAEQRNLAPDSAEALQPYTQVLRRHRASLAAAQGRTPEQLHASDGQVTFLVESEFGPVLGRGVLDERHPLAIRPTTHAEHEVIMGRFRALATGPGVNGNAQALLDLAASDIEMSEAWVQANQAA